MHLGGENVFATTFTNFLGTGAQNGESSAQLFRISTFGTHH